MIPEAMTPLERIRTVRVRPEYASPLSKFLSIYIALSTSAWAANSATAFTSPARWVPAAGVA
jgi:hypothetical protein